MLQGGNMDRVGAYNQRSSAYNMCGANEDDVVEPQRTRRSRRPREYDEVQYEDDDSQSTAPSRGDRGSFDDAPPRRPRRRQREWPQEDPEDQLAPPPTHERRAVKAIAYTRQDEKSPGPAATPSSKGSAFGKLFTPKKPKESFRTKTLTELTETGTSSVARVKEGNVKFPNSWSGHKVTVFNPYHPRRLMWDATMLILIIIIAVVTPFELTFLDGVPFGKADCPTDKHGCPAPGDLFLFWLNRLSDCFFLVDMVLTFNTSFFDSIRGRWVEERSVIAREYLRCWFWLDVLSLLPYSLMFSEIKAAGLIRVIRLVRLLKLLKLAKQPRIMAKLRQFVTMPIKQQTLIKYFFIIFFIIHWTACTLRLLTSFAVGDCRPKGSDMHSGLPFDDECARTYLNTNRRWGQGPWSQYASAIIWSIGAMSGEAYLPANMEETVLNTLVMLMGIVVMAFLVGELSNILGNFDPVGNEFEQTVDAAWTSKFKLCFNLWFVGVWVRCYSPYWVEGISRRSCPSLGRKHGRGAEIARRDRSHAARSEERVASMAWRARRRSQTLAWRARRRSQTPSTRRQHWLLATQVDNLDAYFESNQYPEMLRLKLREYVLLTEPIYREKYYIELMKQFSPALRTTVANFQLSHYVANIPFFAFAIQRGCGFEEGAIMDVQEPPQQVGSGDREEVWRRATIVAADPMTEGYEVAYHDGQSTNETKVSVNRLRAVDQRLHYRMIHINRLRRKFVGDFALRLEPMLFMPGDAIIEANWSRCDSLYLVTTGTCIVVKERLNSMFDIRLRHYGSTIGGDISTLLIAGEKRRLRHYDCKAHNAVQIYKMADGEFLSLMAFENYAEFAKTIKYFGFCMLVKMLTFRQMEKATAAGLTLQQQFAKLEAANPFVREVEPLKSKEKPVKVRLASDLTGLLDQLGLSKSIRSKVVAELKKHEIYNLETAQSLRVEDWDMLDLKMGTRRLILAKLGALGGSYLGSLTDPSQGCARP